MIALRHTPRSAEVPAAGGPVASPSRPALPASPGESPDEAAAREVPPHQLYYTGMLHFINWILAENENDRHQS